MRFPNDRRSLMLIMEGFVDLLSRRARDNGRDADADHALPGGLSFDTVASSLLQRQESLLVSLGDHLESEAEQPEELDDDYAEEDDEDVPLGIFDPDEEEMALFEEGEAQERWNEIVASLRDMFESAPPGDTRAT